jgi:L-aminopeptidase/D-esterase-like protein
VAGHDGLARATNPAHTQLDGDTLFALATGRAPRHPGMLVLAAMAAEAVARATVRAVLAARTLTTAEGLVLPCHADLAR